MTKNTQWYNQKEKELVAVTRELENLSQNPAKKTLIRFRSGFEYMIWMPSYRDLYNYNRFKGLY